MALRNSQIAYGTVAKTLHWATALLFLLAYVAVYYRQWFTERDTPENIIAIQLHFSIGISIGVILILRLLWVMYDRKPDPVPGSVFAHLAAKSGHWLLYLMIAVMVVTGYMGTGANTQFFYLFEIPKFSDTWLYTNVIEEYWFGITFKEFEKPFDFIHKDIGGALLVWMLILGHALAALYHHYVKKDNTLKRMTTLKS
ncbi:MAG: cytochrome b [Hydrogenovibrio sp.]|jgi:cytochrome b561